MNEALTLNGENHSPRVHAAKAVELENRRSQQSAKCSGQRGGDDEQGHPKGQFTLAIPSRQKVHERWHHPRLEEAEHEAHSTQIRKVGYKGVANGEEAKAHGDDGDEPPRPNKLAKDVARNLKDNVGDEEDGQGRVVVIAFEIEVLFEAGDAGVAWDSVSRQASPPPEASMWKY
jgi:hypothetical protein